MFPSVPGDRIILTKDTEIPLYRTGSIEQTILEKGQNYNKLGDLVILFIMPFDPFESSGFYRYTFINTCQEDKNLLLGDGVSKVVLNAAGRIGDISPELKEFLQLIAGDTESRPYSKGSFADRVQRQGYIARRNAKWRKEYMDWEMTLRNEREKGREEERIHTEEQRKRADAEKERADAEKERADTEKERADTEKERADAEKERADAEKKHVEILEEEIRELKGQIAKMHSNN